MCTSHKFTRLTSQNIGRTSLYIRRAETHLGYSITRGSHDPQIPFDPRPRLETQHGHRLEVNLPSPTIETGSHVHKIVLLT